MNYGYANEDSIPNHIAIEIIPLKPKCESKPKEPTDVSVFDWDGRFVATYGSASGAMRALNIGVDTILKSCKKPEPYHILRGTTTKYVFRRGVYKEGDTIRVIKYKPMEKPAPRLKVSQYSLDGAFIKSYTSITKASIESGDSYGMIRNMCLGETPKVPMKYQWRYYTDNYPANIGEFHQVEAKNKNKSVCQFSLDGNYLDTFSSITDASAITGESYGLIRKMCLGKKVIKRMKFQWRYYSDVVAGCLITSV